MQVRAIAVAFQVLLLIGAATAAEAMSDKLAAQISFDIPSQPLSTALKQLADQAGIQILFEERVVRGHEAPAIKANQTAAQALHTLLDNTGLEFTEKNETVAIREKASTRISTQGHIRRDPVLQVRGEQAGMRIAQATGEESAPEENYSQPSGEKAENNESAKIEEITVTATRREASADTIPVSITAYSQATMDEQGIKNIEDLSKYTPGLSFAPSKAGYINNIALRGVLSDVGASTTGIYIDDTPLQVRSKGVVTESAFPQIFDLERVEILKGPQGTLFGTGSMGGTVRFITPEPSLDHFSGYARAEGGVIKGSDSSYEVGAALGGPLIQNALGFRASAFIRRPEAS